ncbi:MAG: choice-of-anchor D domain-containing protein, partial [Ignavibacteria bacterium]
MKAEVGGITIDYIWRGLNRDTIDIGRVCIGKPITEPITIRKIGKGRLTMTSFAANDGAVIGVKANTPISLNDSVSFGYVLVNFTAKQLGTYIVPIIVKFAECSTNDTIWVKHIGVETSMTFIGNGQFGDVRIGDRKEAIYEVRNTGTSDISIFKLPVLPAPFRMVGSNPVPPVDLKPGQAITLTVAFEPIAVGTYTHVMRLVGDSTFTACVDSLNVPLAGRGVASTVVLSPTSLSFPVVAACDSVSECVVVTNRGTTPIT